METERKLYRRRITFKCGWSVSIVSRSEAALDAEQERLEKLNCPTCRIADGTMTDDDYAQILVSILFSRMLEQQQERISRSRVN